MIQATDSTPILTRPHTLRGSGRVRLVGAGEIVLRLEGRGHATIRRGPNDTARFSGSGRLRHLSSEHLQISGASGVLLLQGAQLEIVFGGGPVHVAVQGRFLVETQGHGRVHTPRGRELYWGRRLARFRLEGPEIAGAGS